MMNQKRKLICVGASAGGIIAVKNFLNTIPTNFEFPIAIVQHLKSDSNIDFPLIYSDSYFGKIIEVGDKTNIESNTVYFGPPGYHLLVEKNWSFSLSQDKPVCYSRPSIDVFFESALYALGGNNICGILLTGANCDGAQGLESLERMNAKVFIQNPAEAEFPCMPNAAIERTKNAKVVNISEMIGCLQENSKDMSL